MSNHLEDTMNIEHNPELTSAEMGNLWNFYMANTMSHCIFEHFLTNVEDESIKQLIIESDQLCVLISNYVEDIFKSEGIPLPKGFQPKEDVNKQAPRLFSDTYYLEYLEMMFRLGVIFYSITLPNTARLDIRNFVTKVINSSANISNKITELMLEKGIYVRPPFIPAMNSPEIVAKQSFLNGFFGDKRRLLGVEISQLFANIQFNSVKTVLLIGFSQVAKSHDLRHYFIRGRECNLKQNAVLAKLLTQEDLPITMPTSYSISTSTESPFSDKLMLFHLTNLSSAKLRNFGDSIAVSPRHDIGSCFMRLIMETGNYAEDGTNLLIQNGWLEYPPHNVDRYKLAED